MDEAVGAEGVAGDGGGHAGRVEGLDGDVAEHGGEFGEGAGAAAGGGDVDPGGGLAVEVAGADRPVGADRPDQSSRGGGPGRCRRPRLRARPARPGHQLDPDRRRARRVQAGRLGALLRRGLIVSLVPCREVGRRHPASVSRLPLAKGWPMVGSVGVFYECCVIIEQLLELWNGKIYGFPLLVQGFESDSISLQLLLRAIPEY
ncbi:hypothetical protein FAGKG844_50059 [Frankia sp. AgKG'84/4]